MYKSPCKSTKNPFTNLNLDRNLVFFVILGIFTAIIIIRLFALQVISYAFYKESADKEHYGFNELSAQRGEIFIKDYADGSNVRIATNSTYDLLYVDPSLIKEKKLVTDRLVPLIFNLDDAKTEDQKRVKIDILRAETAEDLAKAKPYTDSELYQNFYNDILEKISKNIRPIVNLEQTLTPLQIDQIKQLNLIGIEITESNQIKAYPAKLNAASLTAVSEQLGKILEIPPKKLEKTLKGIDRYEVLVKKLSPEISAKIKEIIRTDEDKNFIGLVLKDQYYRFYPEGKLAASILGFVPPAEDGGSGDGAYGIERTFNNELRGKKGLFESQIDGASRMITVGDSVIEPALDGKNIVLTIDRSIQMAVEARLEKAVKAYKADKGEVIVMDPKTGRILAMADYPSFDPNNYGEASNVEDISLNEEAQKQLIPIANQTDSYWYYRNKDLEDKIMVFKQVTATGKVIFQKYKNDLGPEVYQNRVVSENYEPGSVFKTIAMSSGIDDKDVTASTAFNDPGFIEIEIRPGVKKKITNVSAKCTGYITMRDVIANSCNTGISFVAGKMGMRLFYNYMTKFGFGQRTEIEFDNESPGEITAPPWADSELYNHAFGQGISVTPLQMATALSVIANKGVMMQPHIIESIEKEKGQIVKTEPSIIRKVISSETAETVTSMMVNAVENGVAKAAALPDHIMAGKTGTSQIFEHGQYVDGFGKFIGTMGGFGPINDPKFVILTKLDRPRTAQYADSTAGLLFKDIAAYLFDYYSIPPDKK